MDFLTQKFIASAKQVRDEIGNIIKGLSSFGSDLKEIKDAAQSIEKQGKAAQEAKSAPTQVVGIVDIPSPIETKRDTYDANQQRRDRWRLLVEVLTLFAVLAYGYLTLRVWREMQVQTKTSQQQLEQSQRPWITIEKIEIPNNYALVIDKSIVMATVKLDMKNIGHSPAINVGVLPVLHCCGGFSSDTVQSVCEGNSYGLAGLGETIFPEREGNPVSYDVSLTKDSVAEYWNLPVGQRILSVVGCVIYRSSLSKESYYTGFSYDILVMAHLPPETTRIPGKAIYFQPVFGFIVK